jgi:hypothetical protein
MSTFKNQKEWYTSDVEIRQEKIEEVQQLIFYNLGV